MHAPVPSARPDIANLYSFTAEELNFIINHHIKYRLARAGGGSRSEAVKGSSNFYGVIAIIR